MQPSDATAGEPLAWILLSLPWLCAAILLAVCACAVGLWVLVARARELERLARRLDALDEVRGALVKLTSERADLDLRRIEHVLLEMRDGGRRLEDALLRAVESGRGGAGAEPVAAGAPATLAERVTNRLLALGYERVQVIDRTGEVPQLTDGGGGPADGEVLVEARRGGVLCKGRVVVRGGAIREVDMKPAYTFFP